MTNIFRYRSFSHFFLLRRALVFCRTLLVDNSMKFFNKSWVVAVQIVEEYVAKVAGPGVKPLREQTELALDH